MLIEKSRELEAYLIKKIHFYKKFRPFKYKKCAMIYVKSEKDFIAVKAERGEKNEHNEHYFQTPG